MIKDAAISFYKVPLVCGAVTSIGCGSRSKPVLLDLQRQASIKQASLNRTGTTVALEWEGEVDSGSKEIRRVFEKHELPAEELKGDEHDESLKSFYSSNQWLAGSAVDKLSEEEAGVIADRLLTKILTDKKLTERQAKEFRGEIQSVFYEFFIDFESLEQLADISVYKDKIRQVIILGEKYSGAGAMPDTNSLLGVCCEDIDCCE